MEEKKEDPFNDPEEQAHFKQVVAAFFNYSVTFLMWYKILLKIDAMRDIARMERDFTKIDPKYLKMLSFDYKKDRISRLKKAVINNSLLLNKIVAEY